MEKNKAELNSMDKNGIPLDEVLQQLAQDNEEIAKLEKEIKEQLNILGIKL